MTKLNLEEIKTIGMYYWMINYNIEGKILYAAQYRIIISVNVQ